MDINIYNKIPNNFQIQDNNIFFTKIKKYILCKFENDVYYIIMDVRHYRETFKILNILKSLDLNYLLVSSYFLDPKNKRYSYEENISKNLYHLFYIYVHQDIFYYTIKKEIKYLEEIVRYFTLSNINQSILKNIIDEINSNVINEYDISYYSNKKVYNVNEDIREYFKTIWRRIQFILLFE